MKRKIKNTLIIIGSVIILLSLVLGHIFLNNDFNIKKTENYYKKNSETFNDIAKTFRGFYEDKMFCADLDNDNQMIQLKYYPNYSNDHSINCKHITKSIEKLNKLNKNDIGTTPFSDIRAYYDENGNMMLQILAIELPLEHKFDDTNKNDLRRYYLVYIDKNYHTKYSYLGIEEYVGTQVKPFSGNWYTWSEDTMSC